MKNELEISYIKGVAILMVIIFHSIIFQSDNIGGILHIEQAVPLFLITSAYLGMNKMKSGGGYTITIRNIKKLFKRIFIPFLLFQALIMFTTRSIDIPGLILSGGKGMGSYYPWLYLQFWLILPFAYNLFAKHGKKGIIYFISACIVLEIMFPLLSLIPIIGKYSDFVWRLFVGRYLFIIPITYLYIMGKYSLRKYMPLIVIGAVFAIIDRYELFNFGFLFYNTKTAAWRGFHWPLYFYSLFLFIILYQSTPHFPKVIKCGLKWLGDKSWEIFLSQMLFFSLFPRNNIEGVDSYFSYILFFLAALLFSLATATIYNYLSNNVEKRISLFSTNGRRE